MENKDRIWPVKSESLNTVSFNLPNEFLCWAKCLIVPSQVGLFRPSESVSKDKPRSGASPLLGLVTLVYQISRPRWRATDTFCVVFSWRAAHPKTQTLSVPRRTQTHTLIMLIVILSVPHCVLRTLSSPHSRLCWLNQPHQLNSWLRRVQIRLVFELTVRLVTNGKMMQTLGNIIFLEQRSWFERSCSCHS